jgi:hypothetical protein
MRVSELGRMLSVMSVSVCSGGATAAGAPLLVAGALAGVAAGGGGASSGAVELVLEVVGPSAV